MHFLETASPSATSRPDWFYTWFDSPYYHLLYRNHSAQEAEAFTDALLNHLELPAQARLLDLACGKGRFSRFLAQRGFDVTGIDLAAHSIEQAKVYEKENLSFFVHDMRRPFRTNYFDGIFNFFTSFGYFERARDDYNTLRAVASGLKKGGIFVLDFFNAPYIQEHLQSYEERTIEGVHFFIRRRIEAGRVIKHIVVEDQSKQYFFEERVKFFTPASIAQLGQQVGLQLHSAYGDYSLGPYDAANSPRMILMMEK